MSHSFSARYSDSEYDMKAIQFSRFDADTRPPVAKSPYLCRVSGVASSAPREEPQLCELPRIRPEI
jgi:hypothetical protein